MSVDKQESLCGYRMPQLIMQERRASTPVLLSELASPTTVIIVVAHTLVNSIKVYR
jgi:hypothetical protein